MADYILAAFNGAIAGLPQLVDFGWWTLQGRLCMGDFEWSTLLGRLYMDQL